MPYATVEQMRAYLKQAGLTAANDELFEDILERATAIIDGELGYSFDTAGVGTEVVYGDGTDFLVPSAFVAGSVTGVTAPSGYTVPDYTVRDGHLIVTRDGVVGSWYAREGLWAYQLAYPYRGGWEPGVPYTVAATFGHSAVPADIVEATLEVAIRIWRAKDAGFSDVVGVEGGGAVGYNGALPAMVKRILDNHRRDDRAGVW
jgi:hypothetical protein